MLKTLVAFIFAATLAAGVGYANQSTGVKVLPVTRTRANSGQQMYTSYCASCHGVDGRGNGPAASSLKQRPADLSVLARNNGGVFPSKHVTAVLQFGSRVSAHGDVSMPVWGPVLGKLDGGAPESEAGALRISNIGRYIETLQVK